MYALTFTHMYTTCTHARTLKHAYTHVHSIQTFACRKGKGGEEKRKGRKEEGGKKGRRLKMRYTSTKVQREVVGSQDRGIKYIELESLMMKLQKENKVHIKMLISELYAFNSFDASTWK